MESLVACVADWLQGERNVKGRRNAFRKSNCFPALSQPPPRGQKAPAHGNRAQAVHTSVCWHLTFLPGKNAGSTMSSWARHTSTGISISTSLLPSHQKPQEHGNAFPPCLCPTYSSLFWEFPFSVHPSPFESTHCHCSINSLFIFYDAYTIWNPLKTKREKTEVLGKKPTHTKTTFLLKTLDTFKTETVQL